MYIKMCLLELSVRDSKLRVLGPRFDKTGDEMHREMETKAFIGLMLLDV